MSEQGEGQEVDFKAQLEATRAELEQAKKDIEQEKFNRQQTTNSFNEYRRQVAERQRTERVAQYDPNAEVEAHGGAEQGAGDSGWQAERIARLEMETFKRNLSDEQWRKVNEIINDPTRAQEVATFDRQGNLDTLTSLQRAFDKVQIQELRAAEARAAEAQEKQNAEVEEQKKQATISGSTASEGQETLDLENMTADEIVNSGLLEMDPRDPVKTK